MRFSVRGSIPIADGSEFVTIINSYTLWRLVTHDTEDLNGDPLFTFEAWVNTELDKAALFDRLKPLIDSNTGSIDWHECTHDEPFPQPCVIAETYTVG